MRKLLTRYLPLWISMAALSIVLTQPFYEAIASNISKSVGAAAAFYQTMQDEGGDLAQEPKLNMLGAGVSCVDNAGVSTDCTITGMAGSAYDQIQDEGVNLTQRTTMDFVGDGATASDTGAKTQVLIPGYYNTVQDEGVGVTQRGTLDFAGAGVACADSGGVKTLCTIAGGGGTELDTAVMTRDAAQSIPNTSCGTPAKILFDAVAFDLGTAITADATTNDRFDINADGVYHVEASWGVTDLSNVAPAIVWIYVDGAKVRRGEIRSSNNLGDNSVPVFDTLQLTSGQFVEMYVCQADSGGAMNTATTTEDKPRMAVTRIR